MASAGQGQETGEGRQDECAACARLERQLELAVARIGRQPGSARDQHATHARAWARRERHRATHRGAP